MTKKEGCEQCKSGLESGLCGLESLLSHESMTLALSNAMYNIYIIGTTSC